MKLLTLLSRVLDVFPQSVSESSIKIRNRLRGTLFVILRTSAVICKQRNLHGNEIVQKKMIYVDKEQFENDICRITQ